MTKNVGESGPNRHDATTPTDRLDGTIATVPRADVKDDPGDLITVVSAVLGFRPNNCMVLVADRPDMTSGITWCALPLPSFASRVAEKFAQAYRGQPGVTVFIVGGGGERAGRNLVHAIQERFRDTGIEEVRCVWVEALRTGMPWASYDEPDVRGVVPNLDDGPLAATLANAGMLAYSDHESREPSLQPVDAAAISRRDALISAALDTRKRMDPEQGARVVRAAIQRAHIAPGDLTDQHVVDLAIALMNSEVRDACLELAVPPRADLAASAERLWLTMVRATPVPERARFASLLAFSCYMRGDLASADRALDSALAADRGHLLAGLISRALHSGVPPHQLADLPNDRGRTVRIFP